MSMTTKDLAEWLREMAYDRAMCNDDGQARLASEAAARLERYAAEDWRSVEEGMPDFYEFCMVCNINTGSVLDDAYFVSGQWFVNRVGYVTGITHWRPRPAPPKQSGGGE